jgi:hypothetical protein|tara:strand:- start:794 stop:1045 length:252 start_codon:yes stop_codon:yes gene_type:complete
MNNFNHYLTEKKMKKLTLSTIALSFLILSTASAQAGQMVCWEAAGMTRCTYTNVANDFRLPEDNHENFGKFYKTFSNLLDFTR